MDECRAEVPIHAEREFRLFTIALRSAKRRRSESLFLRGHELARTSEQRARGSWRRGERESPEWIQSCRASEWDERWMTGTPLFGSRARCETRIGIRARSVDRNGLGSVRMCLGLRDTKGCPSLFLARGGHWTCPEDQIAEKDTGGGGGYSAEPITRGVATTAPAIEYGDHVQDRKRQGGIEMGRRGLGIWAGRSAGVRMQGHEASAGPWAGRAGPFTSSRAVPGASYQSWRRTGCKAAATAERAGGAEGYEGLSPCRGRPSRAGASAAATTNHISRRQKKSTHLLEMRRRGKVSKARTGDRKSTHSLGTEKAREWSKARTALEEKHTPPRGQGPRRLWYIKGAIKRPVNLDVNEIFNLRWIGGLSKLHSTMERIHEQMGLSSPVGEYQGPYMI
ncbi:hypothetical protein B0H14DRAFT_2658368 [Mycena olivaceomarginata]|nr:hypothetical protein B0H14DRAFT_2658368 [Mycena olivaceomarginata]